MSKCYETTTKSYSTGLLSSIIDIQWYKHHYGTHYGDILTKKKRKQTIKSIERKIKKKLTNIKEYEDRK